jgi:hypothetical protein
MTVQTLTVAGQKFALVPFQDYRELLKGAKPVENGLPPLPKPLPGGNYPAGAFMRASIARDVIQRRRALGLSQAGLARRRAFNRPCSIESKRPKWMPNRPRWTKSSPRCTRSKGSGNDSIPIHFHEQPRRPIGPMLILGIRIVSDVKVSCTDLAFGCVLLAPVPGLSLLGAVNLTARRAGASPLGELSAGPRECNRPAGPMPGVEPLVNFVT